MPTTSSYYTDLEYPTVNQDGDTWGTLTNEYLDGLLTKLKNLSDRINSAGVGSDSDLSQILRDISQYDNINASIPTTVKSLFGITDLKAADTYSYATAWNATFDSYLQGFSLTPPQSSSAVQSFDYDLFVEKLQPYVDQAESNITQANADIDHVTAILARLSAGASLQTGYYPIIPDAGISGTMRIWKFSGSRQNYSFCPSSSWAATKVTSSAWDAATANMYALFPGNTSQTDSTNMVLGSFGYLLSEAETPSHISTYGITEVLAIKIVSGDLTIPTIYGQMFFDTWYNASTGYPQLSGILFHSVPTSQVSSLSAQSTYNAADVDSGKYIDIPCTIRMRNYKTKYMY